MRMEELKSVLESLVLTTACPLCGETVRPPLAQCVAGHVVCGECRHGDGITRCPQCQDHFSQVPVADAYRQVVEALPRRCRQRGCPKYIQLDSDHDRFCSFRETPCKHCTKSCPRKDILTHVLEHHPEEKVFTESEPVITCPFLPGKEKDRHNLFLGFGQFFWQTIKADPTSQSLTMEFSFIPTSRPADDYFLEVEFNSSVGPKFLMKTKLNMDPDVNGGKENTIILPYHMVQYFTDNDRIKFSVNITKSTQTPHT